MSKRGFDQMNGFGHGVLIAFSGDLKMFLDVLHASIIVYSRTSDQCDLYSVFPHDLFRAPGSDKVGSSYQEGADVPLDLRVTNKITYVILTKDTIAKFCNDQVGLALVQLM